ncbi:MAG: PD-(D/E)XK nuclease family protein [Oscillospiraceae bacterium]|nr:PD-(D/E)XK nuclease family protein [Oscillospiraceae bacterium]MBR2890667.1 PD-(D/E)XK nuclease family protein [Oscillospiraceae bacterium]
MLRLILGPDWVANREEVLARIARDVQAKQEGVVLMVPELISHDTERRLCAAAGDTASRYAEVLSFTRLLRRVAEREQLGIPECLDGGGRLVAMASTVRMLSSRLKSYANLETRPEFLTGLVDAVDEFKRCCITSGDLTLASGQTSGTLAQKLEELSLILEGYDSVCAQGKQDPRDQMNWLLEQLELCDFAQTHTFYIDGFPDLTRQNMAILAHLIRHSPLVTVSLTCDRPGSEALAFEKAGQTASELLKIARDADVAVEQLRLPGRQDGLTKLRSKLFQGLITPDPGLGSRVKLVRADSVFDECTAAAEYIRELTASGARYRDIGIVTANPERYRGILSLVLRRCGIPAYQSGSDDILEKSAVATVLAAMEAAMEGLEQKTVLRYLKSVLSPLPMKCCDELENYAVLWGIRGEKWNREWAFHPSGLGGEWTEHARDKLARLNEYRETAIGPLIRLRSGLRDSVNLEGQVDALYAFLEEIHLAEGLERLAGKADRLGDNRAAQEYNQLWEILLTALEQMRNVLGHSQWEPEHFSRLLRLLLSQYDVGTIPTVLDSVTVGPVSAMRCQQVRHLLVLGAEEGNLPSYAGSSGVLTDQERTELRRLGVTLTGGGMEGVAAEFAEIYGCFCGAEETVYVSCPTGQSAFLYRRLCTMTDQPDGEPTGALLGPALGNPWEAGAYLARWDEEELASRLDVREGYDETKRKAAFALGNVAREHTQALYGDKLTLSASQIDKQAECRLGYFLRYGLRAQERKEVSVDPAEFGTFVHAVLEDTVKEIMDRGGFRAVDQTETLNIAHRYADAYARERFSELDSERLTYLFQRNTLELDAVVKELWEELSESRFEPMAFELHFGEGGEMAPVHCPGRQMDAELQGFVDRVDRFTDGNNNYFRVVDYKTGRKDFDYCDVFNGVGLQMLLYLFALEQGGEQVLGSGPVSAGVQYFPARFPFLTEDGKLSEAEAAKERFTQTKRRGLILDSETVIRAMEPGEELHRLSCRRKSDGTITGDVATAAQFQSLRAYLFRLLGRMVDDIARGFVAPNPYTRGSSHSACAYCPYGAVCARSREEGRRNYKAMTAQRFWDEIEKEAERHGR